MILRPASAAGVGQERRVLVFDWVGYEEAGLCLWLAGDICFLSDTMETVVAGVRCLDNQKADGNGGC